MADEANSPMLSFVTYTTPKQQYNPPLRAFVTYTTPKQQYNPPMRVFVTYADNVEPDDTIHINTQLKSVSVEAVTNDNQLNLKISWALNGLDHGNFIIKVAPTEGNVAVGWGEVPILDTITTEAGETTFTYSNVTKEYKYFIEAIGVDVNGNTSEPVKRPRLEFYVTTCENNGGGTTPEPNPNPDKPSEGDDDVIDKPPTGMYKFHYVPDEGRLSGVSMEQQTEDAINDIGNYAYKAQSTANEALKIGNSAAETARTALNNAQNAQTTADNATDLANSGIEKANKAQDTADEALAKANTNAKNISDNTARIETLETSSGNQQEQVNQNITDITQLKKDVQANKNAISNNLDGINECRELIFDIQNYQKTEGTDANELTEYGRYYLTQAVSNLPTGIFYPVLFDIVPYSLKDGNSVTCQRVVDNNGIAYYRFGTETTTTDNTTYNWVEWKSIDTRYLKLTGGTVTGQTTFSGKLIASGETSVPTPAKENNSDTIASTKFVHAVVDALVNGAPEALDTLNELSQALGNDPNFSTTILTKIGEKESKEDAQIEYAAIRKEANEKVNTLKEATISDVTESNGTVMVAKGDGTSLSFNTGLTINQIIASSPVHYNRSVKWQGSKTVITVPSYLTININNQGYVFNGTKTIDITKAENWDSNTVVTERAGKDFYVYACQPTEGTVPKFIISENSMIPTGYTENNSRKIGGFHCLCVDVGTIDGHDLSGYVAGDILPASVWDLLHRCKGENEGMVYDDADNVWISIYLLSYTNGKVVSQYNGVILDGTSTPKTHGLWFTETLAKQHMRLPYLHEYFNALKGCQEQLNISGSKDWNTTGGHVYTNNVRCISNIGLEDPTGFMWQWANNYSVAGGTKWLSSAYNENVDDRSCGGTFGTLWSPLVGGAWDSSTNCGSRSILGSHAAADISANYGARSASEPRVVSLI